jgi:lambda family phage portal protein
VGVLDKLAGLLGYVRPRRNIGFAAAQVGRLTASLAAETDLINNQLRYQLRILRARSRQAAQNNPYARRFAQMVVDNVAGPTPFRLQAKVKFNSGKLDEPANRKIEECWRAWGRPGECELSGRFSWNAIQRLLARTFAVDGEILFRKHRGADYGSHGFKIQMIDVDRLDDLKNERLAGGGAIHMGVEIDANQKPVAYHILKRKPASWLSGGYPREHERVPAEDIVHLFIPEYAEQVRGVPWMYAALLNLVHIGAFEEAAVIAARVGAAQMGVWQAPDGGESIPHDGKDAKGNPQINMEPGTFAFAPPGYQLASWNPKYPDAAIEPFLRACLRGVAVGVNVANHNLTGDMTGVNYSSARIAELDERDHWMTLQNFTAEHLHDPLYWDWLKVQVLLQTLTFDPLRLEKYREVYWQGRRWAWVDPQKEVEANIRANEHKLKSRTRIIAEGGDDIEDVLEEIAAEEQLAKDKKVDLAPAKKPSEKPAEEPKETE